MNGIKKLTSSPLEDRVFEENKAIWDPPLFSGKSVIMSPYSLSLVIISTHQKEEKGPLLYAETSWPEGPLWFYFPCAIKIIFIGL